MIERANGHHHAALPRKSLATSRSCAADGSAHLLHLTRARTHRPVGYMNRNEKERRRKARRAERQRSAKTPAMRHVHGFENATTGPCPEAGGGDGELCPSCGKNEVRAHMCSCGERGLNCCSCRYTPNKSEAAAIFAAASGESPDLMQRDTKPYFFERRQIPGDGVSTMPSALSRASILRSLLRV